MLQLKYPKTIDVLSSVFTIEYDKTHNGGSFSWSNMKIVIGIKDVRIDPTYTLSIISHEIMELILGMMGGRFENSRIQGNYLFNFDHQTFENAIQIHSMLITKFIKST